MENLVFLQFAELTTIKVCINRQYATQLKVYTGYSSEVSHERLTVSYDETPSDVADKKIQSFQERNYVPCPEADFFQCLNDALSSITSGIRAEFLAPNLVTA